MKILAVVSPVMLFWLVSAQPVQTPTALVLKGQVIAYPVAAQLLGGNGFVERGSTLVAKISAGKDSTEIVKLISSWSRQGNPSHNIIEGTASFRINAVRDASCDETNATILPARDVSAENLNTSRYVYNQSSERNPAMRIENLACYRVVSKRSW
jgi:hypothetical protein